MSGVCTKSFTASGSMPWRVTCAAFWLPAAGVWAIEAQIEQGGTIEGRFDPAACPGNHKFPPRISPPFLWSALAAVVLKKLYISVKSGAMPSVDLGPGSLL
jgi:hypothetical protein